MTLNSVKDDTCTIEHFCTLFDSNYLPLGMALHQSLMTHALPFHLWIVCMDEMVEQQLQQLSLPHISLLSLKDIETPALLAVKSERSRGEYCWTLTSFTFSAVFAHDAHVQQVTYLDADLFFFADPRLLLQELPHDRHVLFTEHAYAPEYDQAKISGRFCVQFLTFKRTPEAARVMHWWQDRCLEWCFNRVEDGKFGDQRYLDAWTILFAEDVQIVEQVERTLAPWNVRFFEQRLEGKLQPVFYHFHGLKIVSSNRIQLYAQYRIGQKGLALYKDYTAALQAALRQLQAIDASVPVLPLSTEPKEVLRRAKRWLFQETKFSAIG
jgi:hypothetical protein